MQPLHTGEPLREAVEVTRCDLCGSLGFEPELTKGAWLLVRCSECGIVFTSPRYTEDTSSKIYASEYYQGTPTYYASQLAPPEEDDVALARSVRNWLGASGTLRSLDVGSGTGRLVEAFHEEGFMATGIEPNEMAVAAGKKAARQVAAMSIAEVPTRSQECLTGLDVLKHTTSPREFLGHCHRILIERGLLLLEVPNYESGASRRLKEAWGPLYPDTHLFQFSPESLKQYLSSTGFLTLKARRIGGGGGLHPTPSREVGKACRSEQETRTTRLLGRLRNWLWDARAIAFRIPRAKEAVRFVY